MAQVLLLLGGKGGRGLEALLVGREVGRSAGRHAGRSAAGYGQSPSLVSIARTHIARREG
eukprot:366231-Chlamydomonas_euryale.AAC.7